MAPVQSTILSAIFALQESDDTMLVNFLVLTTLLTKVLATNHLSFSLAMETWNASFFIKMTVHSVKMEQQTSRDSPN
jgi:hypothetical protein